MNATTSSSTADNAQLGPTDIDKFDCTHIEALDASKSSAGIDDDEQYSYVEQRRIIHRVDRRLVSTCGILYCVSMIDRNNLSAASIAGLTESLSLDVGFRYSIVVLAFFTTYTFFQAPATVLCRKIGPRIFLGGTTFAWGCTMIGFGFPTVWTSLVALRLILGMLEAGFFPACVYLISTWYSRYDLQKRYSVFYLIGCMATAISGILAYGLMQMDGLANLNGWRWIFIMEGIVTCVAAIAGYFFLVDFPDRAMRAGVKFLNQEECNFIIRRLKRDQDDVQLEEFSVKRFLVAGLDLKIWAFALIFFSVTTCTYAISYFLPIILRQGMGFSLPKAQCLVAPPYIFAGIMMFTTSWVSDKYHLRGPILVFNAIIALIGIPLVGWHPNLHVRYFGVFLLTGGANSNIPASMAYQANNIRGQWKRAFCSVTLVGFGGIGGIAGSLVFRSQDSPQYRPGMYAAIACNLLIVILVGFLSTYFTICNRRAAKGKIVIEGFDGFRYTI